jgi:hypothetical protein
MGLQIMGHMTYSMPWSEGERDGAIITDVQLDCPALEEYFPASHCETRHGTPH